MENTRKNTIKLISLAFLSILIIIINGGSLIKIITKQSNKKEYYYINPIYFYNQSLPNITLKSKKGNLNIPNKKNHLIFGINSLNENEKELVKKCIQTVELDSFAIDVILIKRNRGILNILSSSLSSGVYYYYSSVDSLFHTENKDNFTLLIDSTNIVKFFDYRIIDYAEYVNLIENYKKGYTK
jgi:hypothetical protein